MCKFRIEVTPCGGGRKFVTKKMEISIHGVPHGFLREKCNCKLNVGEPLIPCHT